jgi:hypothetical protein
LFGESPLVAVVLVMGRGGAAAVVGGVVPRFVVVPVTVVVAMEAVRHVAGRARRRRLAEQVLEQPPEPVHRKGL